MPPSVVLSSFSHYPYADLNLVFRPHILFDLLWTLETGAFPLGEHRRVL